jgi:hypothetical protein
VNTVTDLLGDLPTGTLEVQPAGNRTTPAVTEKAAACQCTEEEPCLERLVR